MFIRLMSSLLWLNKKKDYCKKNVPLEMDSQSLKNLINTIPDSLQ
jgi:hypothetical protein